MRKLSVGDRVVTVRDSTHDLSEDLIGLHGTIIENGHLAAPSECSVRLDNRPDIYYFFLTELVHEAPLPAYTLTWPWMPKDVPYYGYRE